MNKSLRILFLFNSVFVFASSLLGPLYAIYVTSLSNKVIDVSVTWAVFLVATVLFELIVSRFGDRIKEKEYLLAAGFFVRAWLWIGYIFIKDISGLLMMQIISGLGEALGTPAFNVIFAEHIDKKKVVAEYSWWNIVSSLMVALATIVGGIVVTVFGFEMLFFVMGVIALMCFAGVLWLPRKIL